MRFLFLLLLWPAAAISIRGKELAFSNYTRTGRTLSSSSPLKYVRSREGVPPGVAAHQEALGPGVYLVRGEIAEGMEFGEWTPEMKYDAAAFKTGRAMDVVVRSDAEVYTSPAGCEAAEAVGEFRWRVKCPTDEFATAMAEDERVLWFSRVPKFRAHAYESRRLLLGTSHPSLNGSGIRVTVSDTGLDEFHCMFYDSAGIAPKCAPNPLRAKVVDMCKITGADYLAVTNAHGTATAGVAAGYACLSETGVAPSAKIAFIDIAVNEDLVHDAYLRFPMTSLMDKIAQSGASIHSASWGPGYDYEGVPISQYDSVNPGSYTDADSTFDASSRSNPTLVHVRSAGNDGPWGRASSMAKNGLVVGACLSRAEAYPTLSPSQRASDPDLYSHHSQIYFSSRGPSQDGRTIPQVCAPGYRVKMAKAFSYASAGHADWLLNDGTSFSAPAIAGLVAVLQQRYKDGNGGVMPTAALVEVQLMVHASKPTRVVEPNGSGLRSVSGAPSVTTLGTPILDFERWTDVDGLSLTHSGRVAVCLEKLAGVEASWDIGVRWTDPASVDSAYSHLINDLDAVVSSSGFARAAQNGLDNFELAMGVPAQHTRVVVFAYEGFTTFGAQAFALHARAKASRVECAAHTWFPYEYPSCTNGIQVFTTWKGDLACKKTSCAAGTCGEDCGLVCGETPCVVSGGSGKLDEGGVCRPSSCADTGLFVTDAKCACQPHTSVYRCPLDGSLVACDATGAFPACAAQASSIEQKVVSSSSSSLVGGPMLWMVCASLLLFLV